MQQDKTTSNTILESTAEARAERLKRIRNLANLSRQEICQFEGLNINTYKGWEIARYGGLTFDGAQKVLNRVKLEGVICNFDWLWSGVGISPYIIPKVQTVNDPINHAKNIFLDTTHELLIFQQELSLFQNNFSNSIIHQVNDDCLDPFYKEGDYVGGVCLFNKDILLLDGKFCIVETLDGLKLTRLLKISNQKKINLIATNLQTTTSSPILIADLAYAAEICRLYRLSK